MQYEELSFDHLILLSALHRPHEQFRLVWNIICHSMATGSYNVVWKKIKNTNSIQFDHELFQCIKISPIFHHPRPQSTWNGAVKSVFCLSGLRRCQYSRSIVQYTTHIFYVVIKQYLKRKRNPCNLLEYGKHSSTVKKRP